MCRYFFVNRYANCDDVWMCSCLCWPLRSRTTTVRQRDETSSLPMSSSVSLHARVDPSPTRTAA